MTTPFPVQQDQRYRQEDDKKLGRKQRGREEKEVKQKTWKNRKWMSKRSKEAKRRKREFQENGGLECECTLFTYNRNALGVDDATENKKRLSSSLEVGTWKVKVSLKLVL